MVQHAHRSMTRLLIALLTLAVSLAHAQVHAPDEPVRGGTVVVAASFEPDNLDPMKITRAIVSEYTIYMVEGLFHVDADGRVQPHLVDSFTVSDDQLTYTFTLRANVPFHDGNILSSDDVIASMQRWSNWGQGRDSFQYITSLDAIDDLTFTVTLSEPYPLLITMMAVPAGTGLYIYPRWLVEEVGTADMQQAVGTGPFVFDRWQRGSLFRVTRFDDYAARSEPTSGYAGNQAAWVDAVEYRLIPDPSVRLAGVETGEFDVAREMPTDFFEMVESNPNLRVFSMVGAPIFIQIDRSHGRSQGGWTGMQRFRQAVSLALDKHLLASTVGHPDFASADDCNLAVPPAWHTDICQERYHAFDPEQARAILEEIGYDGEQLIYVVDPNREIFFNPALLAVQMMRDVGINVELMPVDAATVLDMRERPRTWDFIQGGHSEKLDPTTWSPVLPDHFGWFGAYPPELQSLLDQLRLETDLDARIALWEQYTDFWYDWVPMVKVADQFTMHVENVRYSGSDKPGSGIYVNHGAGWKAP